MFWRLTQQQELPDHETRIKTMLIVEAMWTLMSEKLGLTDEDLYKRCLELDLQDGKLDGQARRPLLTCASCARETPQRFARCMYCNAALPASPF